MDSTDTTSDTFLRAVANAPALAPTVLAGGGEALLDGRFVITQPLGAGGFGAVYEVRDRERDALVALKRLSRLNADSLHRFKKEFRAAAGLGHPNIITLHELFIDSTGCPFFTMELVSGGHDLVTWVRRPSASPAELEGRLISAMEQLANAVSAIHAVGLIHRDLKPSNVLVRHDGSVVVLDFGLVVEADNTKSAAAAAGTPAYMAPEQTRGEKVGPSADWYAVGGILYECLTGERAFDGDIGELLRLKHGPAPDPLRKAPNAPTHLAELCMRLLDPVSDQRPSGAEVLAAIGSTTVSVRTDGERLFVGRANELGALRRAFSSMRSNRASVAFLHGPSGIGKSALLRAFARDLTEPKVLVCVGRCYEREQLPFKGLDALMGEVARHLESLPSVEAASLLPRDVDALTQLFPSFLRVDVVLRALSDKSTTLDDPIQRRRRGARAIRELLQRFGDRYKTVLIIDDVQWGDEDSSMILADVLLPPDAPSVMFVVAYRDEDTGERFARSLAPYDELVDIVDLALEPMDEQSARALVSDVGERIDDVVREASGNPFFLIELARAGAGASLSDVVMQRVGKLPSAARSVLELLAVAGRPLDRSTLVRGASVDGDVMLEAVTTLRQQLLIRMRANGTIEPYHDRIREAVASALTQADTRSRHSSLALALDADAEPQLMAYHLRMMGDHESARHHAEKAGDRAMEQLAFDRAARHFDEAASGDGGGALLLVKLADALIGAGRARAAAETLLRASALVDGTAEVRDLQRRAAEQYFRTGMLEEGIETIRPLMHAVGLSIPNARWWMWTLLVYNYIVLRLVWRIEGRRHELADQRAELCETLWTVGNYRPHTAALFSFIGARHARHAGDRRFYTRVLVGCMAAADDDRLRVEAGASAATAPPIEKRRVEGWMHWAQGIAAARLGRLMEARNAMLAAESSFDGEHLAYERGITRTWLLEMLWQRGELREYARRGREHLLEYRGRGDAFGVAWAESFLLPRTLLIEDRAPQARKILDNVGLAKGSPDDFVEFAKLGTACELAIYENDPEAVRAARERYERFSKRSLFMLRSSFSVMRAYALGTLGLCDVTEGNRKVALRVARKLETERAFGTQLLYAPFIRAGLEADPLSAAESYNRVATMVAEYPMHRLAARLRAAELRGDSAARDAALEELSAHGVVNPIAFVRLLAPRAERPSGARAL